MKEFQAAVDAGKEKEKGFPSAAYAVSKAGLIGGTRALARETEKNGSKVTINSCCPGFVISLFWFTRLDADAVTGM
jgi:carbonyl reductase 1